MRFSVSVLQTYCKIRDKHKPSTADNLMIPMRIIILLFFVFQLFIHRHGYTEDGVTESEILIGSVNVQDGPARVIGQQITLGMNIYFRYINEKGGIHGRKLKLITYNDGYEPIVCGLLTYDLIKKNKVFMLANYVGTPTTAKAQVVWTEQRVPMVGAYTGAEFLRTPFNPYTINVRASYHKEIDKAVHYFVTVLKVKRIAVFYQQDQFGETIRDETEETLSKYNLKPIAYGSFIRNTADIQKGLDTLKEVKPDLVIMAGSYLPLAKFVKTAKQRGLAETYFYTVSFVGAEALVENLQSSYTKVFISQVVPPHTYAHFPLIKLYHRLLQKYYPQEKANSISLEGLLNAVVIAKGLEIAGRELSRENFIKSIEKIKGWDPGINQPISFSSTNHQGLNSVYLLSIGKKGTLTLVE